ncbi:DUF5123 domain-containing protein [Flavobacterium agrisoli]|uniref:DUF5123 domain-containing protein n=1 Tax=Flavobacterium agrisoli TaxID=2793066 RepID=A0A934PNT8_9FLAO|nr:DUF5123 domain-containing protein [Flavobacterium agrisoli]MBK0369891.1 DUF5123 domain-containing protein [Flavobacterium agrisoli]
MNGKHILKYLTAILLVVGLAVSCESYNEPLLDGLGNSRQFSPTDVTAKIRNQTNVELNWMTRESDDHYVVEFSADDTTFGTIFKTVEVTAAQLPVTVALEGETLYSIRVKAVSASGLEDSKWTVVTATTLSEQLFLPIQDTDIASKQATLRWTAGSNVTKIVANPGEITHIITAEEKAAGVAVVTGLSPETNYQADLFNGTKRRGATTFTTGVDIGDGILVKNDQDLIDVVKNATSGAKLFLEPGEYKTLNADNTYSTEIKFDKSITISGIPGKEKPLLRYKFTAEAGVSNVSLLNLELDGRIYGKENKLENINNAALLTLTGAGSNYSDILISGCKVHDYSRALVSASNATLSKIASITVENCEVTNVNTNAGADFIDVRTAYVASIVLKNSTFNACSEDRDFIRVDAAKDLTATGLTTNVLVESCTLNNVSNSPKLTDPVATAPKRILYVRFDKNASVLKNTLITNTNAIHSNQTTTNMPVFAVNNYFNATNFQNTAIGSNKVDGTGTTLNPGFANAANGDFTISNQDLKDNKVGDPRWIK